VKGGSRSKSSRVGPSVRASRQDEPCRSIASPPCAGGRPAPTDHSTNIARALEPSLLSMRSRRRRVGFGPLAALRAHPLGAAGNGAPVPHARVDRAVLEGSVESSSQRSAVKRAASPMSACRGGSSGSYRIVKKTVLSRRDRSPLRLPVVLASARCSAEDQRPAPFMPRPTAARSALSACRPAAGARGESKSAAWRAWSICAMTAWERSSESRL